MNPVMENCGEGSLPSQQEDKNSLKPPELTRSCIPLNLLTSIFADIKCDIG